METAQGTTHTAEFWDNYQARCEEASDFQGATAIAETLRAYGFSVEIEQTGGLCMVPTIYSDSATVCVTDEGDYYLVGVYPAATDEEWLSCPIDYAELDKTDSCWDSIVAFVGKELGADRQRMA